VGRRALRGTTSVASVLALLALVPAVGVAARTGKRVALPIPPFVDLQRADGSTIYEGAILLHSLSFGVSGWSGTSAVCEGVRFRPRSPSPLQTHELYAAFAGRAALKVAKFSGALVFQGHPRGRWTLELKQAVISAIHTALTNDASGQDFTDDVTLSPRAMTLTIRPVGLGPGNKSSFRCQ
jgi:hypothetical protein